jgi:hypothetical protein
VVYPGLKKYAGKAHTLKNNPPDSGLDRRPCVPVWLFFCRFQDRQVVGANLRLALESPLLVQAVWLVACATVWLVALVRGRRGRSCHITRMGTHPVIQWHLPTSTACTG